MKKFCMIVVILGGLVSFSSCSKILKAGSKIMGKTSSAVSHNGGRIGYVATRVYRQYDQQQNQIQPYSNYDNINSYIN